MYAASLFVSYDITSDHISGLENPDLLGNFRYLPILKAYVEENNLTARVTWDRQSGPSPGDQTRWEHRATFMCWFLLVRKK